MAKFSTEPVIIVGAGIAGLSAARSLVDTGRNVVIVEARKRIGGRIFTDRSFIQPIDLGASWVHGSQGNPLTDITRDFEILTKPAEHRVTVYSPGSTQKKHSFKNVSSQNDFFKMVFEKVEKAAWNYESDIPLGVVCRKVFQQSAFQYNISDTLIDAYLKRLSIIIGADLDSVSARHWDEDRKFPGDDLWFPMGYDGVVAALSDDLPIISGERVKRVALVPKGVAVETSNGIVTGCAAIITVPLGVLQDGSIQFDPPLPLEKQRSIERLKMGTLDKAVLCFHCPFWPGDIDHIVLPAKFVEKGVEFFSFFHDTDNGAYCIGWVAADEAIKSESIARESRVAQAFDSLKEIFGNDIPRPKYSETTNWYNDPHSRGSYSYVPVGASGEDFSELSTPLYERIFFAGEATCTDYPSTVHGAYCSGIREAKRIV